MIILKITNVKGNVAMDKFSPKHFAFLILGVSIVSMKTYPRVFIINGQRESWIAVIVSSILIFLFYIYFIKNWINYNKINFVDLYRNAYGKKFGNVLLILFMVTCFFVLIECASVEADAMHQNMMILTPKWYFLLFFIIPIIYVIRRDLVAIVTVTMIGITLIMLAGINLGMLTISYKDPAFLFPVFAEGPTKRFFLCILETLGLYGSISITFPYLKEIKAPKKNMILYIVIAMIILIQIEIVSITGVLTTFTIERAGSINYPKLLQTQLVSYFQFLDFGELYVMLQMLGGWMLKYLIAFYAMLSILRMMNFNEKKIHLVTYIVSSIALICSYFASRDSFILFELLDIFQYICLVNFVIIPFMAFFILNMKKKLQTFYESN
ncbi:MAG: GerAB/ArcD/ProY family transporter [Eubacteriales bacterium]